MVYILITSLYPLGKAEEVAKAYLEVRKTPLDRNLAKRVVPLAVRMTKEGIKVIAVYEVKPGKAEEALADLSKRVLPFGEVEGYKLEVETLLSGSEALSLLGLKMPEGD
ncbi:MAG: hypothetical protein ACFFDK_12035 [Promethearchaeota archaeon]